MLLLSQCVEMAVGGRVWNAHSPPNVSRSLDRIFDDAQTTSELKLCGRKLKEYPKGALKYNLSDTVIADLSKNRFSELPSEICGYLSLEELRLHHNVLKSLPSRVASLQALTLLILSRNQLAVLPGCVCRLVNLKVLDVSGNRLVSLPEELGLLTKLTELDASYNQLQVLPPSVGDLDDLRRLMLRRNHLQNVPTELCFLRLVFLDLTYNRITTLPAELRFMTSLLDFLLDANPLTHPPANICMRGRVHIFKWLDQSAAKEDKKRGVLSEVEFRKTRKYNNSSTTVTDFRLVNGFLEGRHKRNTFDSGYSTSENGDPRWSNDSQEFDPLRDFRGRNINGCHSAVGLPALNANVNGFNRSSDGSEQAVSGHSTPSTLSPGETFNLEDEFYKAMRLRDMSSNHTMDPSPDEFSNGRMGPDGATSMSPIKKKASLTISNLITHPQNPDPGGGGSVPAITSPLSPSAPVPTYREYLEAKRQQRAMEANNIYKRQGGDGISPTSEHASAIKHTREDLPNVISSSRSRPSPTGASVSSSGVILGAGMSNLRRPVDLPDHSKSHLTRAQVKNIQKEAVLSYVKSRVSPCKSPSPTSSNTSYDSGDGAPFRSHPPHPTGLGSYSLHYSATKNSHFSGTNGSAIPVSINSSSVVQSSQKGRSNSAGTLPLSLGILKSRRKSGGGQPFDPELHPSRHNFTYRREIEKQQHERQLINNLRDIIETRLKMSLPSDLSSALMDGVVLCHLVNHVRPRAVASIHVPSPAVPKLTIAKCRLNVENFLDSCRRIGVEEEYVCSASDILEERGTVRVAITVERLLQFYQGRNTPSGGTQTPV